MRLKKEMYKMSSRNILMLSVMGVDQLIGHNHTFLFEHAYEHENRLMDN